jgi:N-acetylated-alpha-linked acidic dipeptidase
MEPVLDAAARLSASAARASQALRAISAAPLDSPKAGQINHALAAVEQAFLAPEGLAGRPWFKHVIYAPGSYAGYAAELLPGEAEALDRKDSAALHHEAESLAAALLRASSRLDDVARLAREGANPAPAGH